VTRRGGKGMIIPPSVIPSKGTVLIVDDDPAVRGSLEFCLKIEGYNVRTYACGADLLDDPNVPVSGCLVIDYHLPDMTGLELLAELRRCKSNLPAILITSNPSNLVRARTITAGAVMIEKPLLTETLFEGIRTAMRS
jgi:FixJ family two-component response regulator